MSPTPQQRRAARHQLGTSSNVPAARRGPSGGRKPPITGDAIIDAAFAIGAAEGYEALTMRRVAVALETGPSSLYAHVVNKEDLDELLIGRLCAGIELPEPDPGRWREQITSVCAQLRDQYLRYPGISRAAFAAAPTNLDIIRVSEGMLAILLAGGLDPQAAAWAIDSLTLYVNAYTLELALASQRLSDTDGDWVVGRDEMLRRFAALPDGFPQTKRYAAELTAGTSDDRFGFTLGLMIGGAECSTWGSSGTGTPAGGRWCCCTASRWTRAPTTTWSGRWRTPGPTWSCRSSGATAARGSWTRARAGPGR